MLLTTLLAFLSFAALVAAGGNTTVWVTQTEIVTIGPSVMNHAVATQMVERQNDGIWTPDATFVNPTPWVPVPSEPVWTPQVPVPPGKSSEPIPKTPGERTTDNGKVGLGIVVGLIAAAVGLAFMGCLGFWMKKHGWCCSYSRQKRKGRAKARATVRDLEAARGLDGSNVAYPPRVAYPGTYIAH
ncbi:uncharacterized protein EI97DRAFT_459061 [Westerdykella ornata]|uniref:Mid2 domain-containing protein n=1 Tax=Westerdykella ornata TaxID=318751 RepID=A0A6A6JI04_WESOR|nr:uncharacterized protein EI97DRAFT_459061 [Westerdykella ornata]KAF2275588.1 hypothetical protein EI97DRAFT_459061 [Westerdykella ornata]